MPLETDWRESMETESKETILLVDDCEATVRAAERALRRAGYAVLSAHDGACGLPLFRQHRDHIGLVLTDVVMPNMGGDELAERVDEIAPGIPVLYFTGDVAHASRIEEQGKRVVYKPFDGAGLTRAVREALETPRASVPARAG